MKLPIKDIKPNPENPRQIKDDKYRKLVKSLKEFPEMADVREIVVNKDHVILGGNMRFRAMQEAGWKEVPVKVVDWSKEKQREFVIKDNSSFGEWDYDELANQYGMDELEAWGIDKNELKIIGDKNEDVIGDVEFAKELREKNNYIVLVFDDEIDWLSAVDTLGLKQNKSLNTKDNYQQIGIGRVINGADIIKKLND